MPKAKLLNILTLLLLAVSLMFLFLAMSGCAASNYGDPTRPDIREKQKKIQQQNLRQYGE